MEAPQETISIPADRSELAGLRTMLRHVCQEHGLRASTVRRLVLAVDEAAANILEHGGVERDAPVEVTLELDGDSITVKLTDHGREFDASVKRNSSATDCPFRKRGFGLYLIHLVADDVRYRRTEDDRNVLTLTIKSR